MHLTRLTIRPGLDVPAPKQGGIGTDESRDVAVIGLDRDLYSEDVALKAAYWLSDRCHIHVRHAAEGALVAEVHVKANAGIDLKTACGEFCNALADAALRARVAAETATIQEALLQRAFIQLLPEQRGG